MYCVVDSDDDEPDIQLADDQIATMPEPRSEATQRQNSPNVAGPSNQATQRHAAAPLNVVPPENSRVLRSSANDAHVAGPSNQATQRHAAPLR